MEINKFILNGSPVKIIIKQEISTFFSKMVIEYKGAFYNVPLLLEPKVVNKVIDALQELKKEMTMPFSTFCMVVCGCTKYMMIRALDS